MVRIETSMGEIVLDLSEEKAPKTVTNFLEYVAEGHYNNRIFHRVINGFMILGGGMTVDLTQKPGRKPIENEAVDGLQNDAYEVAMACKSNPDSATAQFFSNAKKKRP